MTEWEHNKNFRDSKTGAQQNAIKFHTMRLFWGVDGFLSENKAEYIQFTKIKSFFDNVC